MRHLNNICLALASLAFFISCSDSPKKPSKRPLPPPVPTEDYLITIHTKFGDMKAILFRETPQHRDNFIKLVQTEFYDSTTFHRVIPGFMIQGGDPNSKDSIVTNDGQGGPGYTISAEIKSNLTHRFGAIAAARLGGPQNPEKRSSGSQFYIVENKQGTPQLNNEYTVFGQVIEGLDIIEKIAQVETSSSPRDRPLEDVEMSIEVKEESVSNLEKRYGKGYNKQ